MKTIIAILSAIVVLSQIGCDEHFLQVDNTPPLSPKGLYAFAGDDYVELSWLANGEADLEGYNIFVSTTPSGKYQYIGSTKSEAYYDKDARNGITYYYKLTSYDYDGNESILSKEYAYATPRPEGFDVDLKNYRDNPNYAGYDFSTNTIGPYDDQYTDLFFEYFDGIYYFNVWNDTEIQDMGYTSSLDEIAQSPTRGWSPTGDVRLIAGHTYVLKTWDAHYAKVRVISLSANQVIFDWAYQLQSGNTFLKKIVANERGKLNAAKGFSDRHN
ncbi:MAG: hypothetical protein HZB59_02000 [Ignavibacteriales bacterium]|nr:hypothetical protein [Ignavibacteriales bacterium]